MRPMCIPILVLFCGLIAACGAENASQEAALGSSSDAYLGAIYPSLRLERIPPAVRERAESFLRSVKNTAMAPEWTQSAQLEPEVRPLFRPDLAEVAYYEFGVTHGGFLVLSSADHDHLVPHWASHGERPTDLLIAQAGADAFIQAFYKPDTLTYVAEDSAEHIVGQLGKLPPMRPAVQPQEGLIYSSVITSTGVGEAVEKRLNVYREVEAEKGVRLLSVKPTQDVLAQPQIHANNLRSWTSWKQLKAEYGNHYRPLLRRLSERVQKSKSAELQAAKEARIASDTPRGDPNLPVWAWTWARLSDELKYDLNYKQFWYGDCYSGCGPTAWAIMMGYGALMGKAGYYACGERLFSGHPPQYNNATVEALVRKLHNYLETYCWGDSGVTSPWNMDQIHRYLGGRQVYYTLNSDYSLTGRRDSLRDKAIKTLNSKRPAVIGTGFYSHYAVALGYGRLNGFGARYFYVNNGWGGSGNGWIPAEAFFYGDYYTWGCKPKPPCPPNRYCCAPGPNNTCRLCVPVGAHCP